MRRRKTERRGRWGGGEEGGWEHINRPLTDTSIIQEAGFLKKRRWMETCCPECDKTSLDINLKGLRDLEDNGVFLSFLLRIIPTIAAEMEWSAAFVTPSDDVDAPIISLCDGNEWTGVRVHASWCRGEQQEWLHLRQSKAAADGSMKHNAHARVWSLKSIYTSICWDTRFDV